jgi:flagellar biosynthesis protein
MSGAGRLPIAVALRYDGTGAPRVTAKGRAELAERIVAAAREHGIPLQDDPALAAVLSRIPLGDEIPETLYRAVAEVIAFAYLLSGRIPPGLDAATRQTVATRMAPEPPLDREAGD